MLYEDRTFENETIALDGNQFRRCKFVNCTLTYSGGELDLDSLRLEGGTEIEMLGAAERTQRLILNLLSAQAQEAKTGGVIEVGGKTFKLVDGPDDVPDL